MNALLAGLSTGLSLIVAIGAQNAYLLRLGLTRQRVGLALAICIAADVALIFAGTAGIGAIVRHHHGVLSVIRWVGVAYLAAFALRSAWNARKPGHLEAAAADPMTMKATIATTAAFTFLNPHVYLDTVLLVGSIANQYGAHRWLFALGAAIGSTVWFTSLGFGAKAAAPLMAKPMVWRVLDLGIAVVMAFVAYSVATTPLPA